MPQALPFFFVNQVTFLFLCLFTCIYFFSKVILPTFLEVFTSRLYITRLLFLTL